MKRFTMTTFAIFLGIATTACVFCPPTPPGGALEGLARLSDAETGRVSSYNTEPDIDANADKIVIKPGETAVLAEIDGPGAITHIWCTIASKDQTYPRSLVLRMYWDGNERPAVESPIGDFFAVGHGLTAPVNSAVVECSSEGRARNCYWRMPFRKSAKITVTNDSPQTQVNAFYYYIDYEKVSSMPKNTPNFHAQYRQEYPCDEGDYLILDTYGRGHYVGTVLSVENTRTRWFGEGDDRFYIDGDETPTLHGTGTEDYFSDAWGFRRFNQPYHGVTVYEGMQSGGRTTAYRWHIVDPIRFKKSLRFEIEHTGPIMSLTGKRVSPYGERKDHYSSVAFWYQTGRAKRFAKVPPIERRLAPAIRISVSELTEKGAVRASKGSTVTNKKPSTFRRRGKPVWLRPTSAESAPWIEIDFEVPIEGYYRLTFTTVPDIDGGDYRVSLDREPILDRVSFFSDGNGFAEYETGIFEFCQGRHTLRFDALQKTGSRVLAIEDLVLSKLP